VVDLGCLPAAVIAGPAIPVQDHAPQQGMDAALSRIGGGRVPVEQRIRRALRLHKEVGSLYPVSNRRNPRRGGGFGLAMEAPRFELGSADAVRGCLQV